MSATVDGGISVSYRPAGSSTLRAAQPSRVDSCSSNESTGTLTKSAVATPAHALALSRLALISTEPVRWVCRRRTPVDDARNVVATSCRAKPYSWSAPAKLRLNDSASPSNTSAPVPGTGASQSSGMPVPVNSGAASRASGASSAASAAAVTRAGISAGSTSAEDSDPIRGPSSSRTIEITVVLRLVDTPLVVIELPAQRRDASARSVTSTMVAVSLSALGFEAASSAISTTCCALITIAPPLPGKWVGVPSLGACPHLVATLCIVGAGHRPPSVRVLSTLTLRNSADGQPWLTAATWPGWDLPQLNAPPTSKVCAPPTASIAFQKSVVVA